MEKNRLIHDINSAIYALDQSIDLLVDLDKTELATYLPLLQDKIDHLSKCWVEIKDFIK